MMNEVNIQKLLQKKACKTAGGRRVRRRVRKNPLYKGSGGKGRNGGEDGSDGEGENGGEGGSDEGGEGRESRRPQPKVTGLAQLKNLEQQVQELHSDISSVSSSLNNVIEK